MQERAEFNMIHATVAVLVMIAIWCVTYEEPTESPLPTVSITASEGAYLLVDAFIGLVADPEAIPSFRLLRRS